MARAVNHRYGLSTAWSIHHGTESTWLAYRTVQVEPSNVANIVASLAQAREVAQARTRRTDRAWRLMK
ncbi:hypothetical protein ABZ863_22475 [Saccharomonospora sp. NPDC046836]|uniref:hypothetical protein n=1 Tax=Saccharomonospora sp. NPDC046836 TaxID=3156921 RepID=UPI0033E927D3